MATTYHHEREDGDEVEDLPLERDERGRQDDHADQDEEPESEHDPELIEHKGKEKYRSV